MTKRKENPAKAKSVSCVDQLEREKPGSDCSTSVIGFSPRDEQVLSSTAWVSDAIFKLFALLMLFLIYKLLWRTYLNTLAM